MSATKTWLVEVYGYDEVRFDAASANKARYRAFLQFREAFGQTSFGDFIRRGVKVRPEVAR